MINDNSEARLILTLTLGSRTLNLELVPSTTLVLGRSPTADIHVDEVSVSGEHLKLKFTGSMLVVCDMGSTNGTFRLPNEAPFAEAEFSLIKQNLNLRLGKVEVLSMQWELKPALSGLDMTRTAIDPSSSAAPGESAIDAPKAVPLVVSSSAVAASASSKPSTSSSVLELEATADLTAKKKVSAYFKFFALLVYSAAVLASSKMLWREDLGFVERVPKDLRGVGLGIDILAVSLAGYSLRGWMIATMCLVLAYVFYRFWIKSIKHFKLRLALGIWATVVSVWPLVYPFVLAARNGVAMSHLSALRDSQRIFESSAYTLEEKTKIFSDLLPKLQGSSYFYSKVINLFFERVVDECGGAWKDDWNKKKLCLILINSVSVEALSDMKPKVLAPIALRLVLITSLDSIMRIFPVEGPGSEMNSVFFKSLESVGLKEEASRIRGILEAANTTSAQKLDSLQKLKTSVELRLDALNYELAIPDVMRVYPPDVLALGI